MPRRYYEQKQHELQQKLQEKSGQRVVGLDRMKEIDEQWGAAKPRSQSERKFSGERRMLYTLLDDDERLEIMVGGNFRKDTDRKVRHEGVAIATSKRVLFLDKGLFGSTEVMEIAYGSIESITHSTGILAAGVQVVGRGASSYRIEDVYDKGSVPQFVARVRWHLSHAEEATGQSQGAPSVAEEIGKLADLLAKNVLTPEEFEAAKKRLLG